MTGERWPHAARNLRDELARLRAAGLLRRVRRRADPRFEIAAVARRLESGPALLFDHVGGPGGRVVINTQASRELVAASLGVAPSQVARRYLAALDAPRAPVVVAGDAPVQEQRWLGDDIDLRRLPVLTHHERDAGPYITTGVAVAEDVTGRVRNLSYHRMHLRGARDCGFVVVPRHLNRLLTEAEGHGRALPVAVVIGLDAATRLAAASSGSAVPFGFDELAVAGALHGRAVPLVRCLTIPVHVPAEAEIVIEGEIVAGRVEDEGPFAEFDGRYESEPARVFRAHALTCRRDPIYQGLLTGAPEQLNIMGLPNEAVVLRSVRAVLPDACDVRVTLGGLRKFHAVVSIDKRHDGDGKDAILAAFGGHRDLKHVVVVDGDVPVHNGPAVERALATWFQASRDLVAIHGGRANPVDRSAVDGQTDRLGFDATRPLGAPGESARAIVPGAEMIDVMTWLDESDGARDEGVRSD